MLQPAVGARAAGSKFVYMRNAAALLELALCNWALQRAAAAGFTPLTTPDLVRESLLEKCGFQPRGDTTQASALHSVSVLTRFSFLCTELDSGPDVGIYKLHFGADFKF